MTKFIFTVITTWFFFLNLILGGFASADSIINTAFSLSLHEDPQWLALGHYKNTDEQQWLSEIDDLAFFIAADGKSSSKNELKASINKLLDSNNQNSPLSFKCRYPARYLFLVDRSTLPYTTDLSDCENLTNWLQQYSADSVSIIYPSSFLSNPASVFGHTFLRFDLTGRANSLSYSVDFSARIPANEGLFTYISQGLSGGYKGIFSIRPYYIKSWEYSDKENRKIWEYKLKFSAEETRYILLHLWELRGRYLDYYFLDENCSYQILSLLAVVSADFSFREQFNIIAIPSDTIKFLSSKNAIVNISYLPTLAEEYLSLTDNAILDTDHEDIIESLISNEISIEQFINFDLDVDEQESLLKATSNLLHHQIRNRTINQSFALNLINEINKQRLQLIPETSTNISPETVLPKSVASSHDSSRLGLSFFNFNNTGYLKTNFRSAYHSLDDPLDGFPSGSEIEALKFSFLHLNHQTHLEQFTLLSLTSINPNTLFDRRFSWAFEISRKRLFIDNDGELINQANIDIGKSISLSNASLYLLANMGVTYNSIIESDLSISNGYKVGVLLQNTDLSLQIQFASHNLHSIDSFRYKDLFINLSFPVSRDYAIKFTAGNIITKSSRSNNFEIGSFYYF